MFGGLVVLGDARYPRLDMRLISARTGLFGVVGYALFGLTLPVSSGGCGRTACFVYSQVEYDAHGGTCPSQASALPNFSSQSCLSAVVSVDGPGDFTLNADVPTQSLCCYPVTQRQVEPDFTNGECVGTGGAGGVGGFFGEDVGVGVGVGGGFGCVTCGGLLNGKGTIGNGACFFEAQQAWDDLKLCACDAASACFNACQLSLCIDAVTSEDCRACLVDTAASGCDAAVAACNAQ